MSDLTIKLREWPSNGLWKLNDASTLLIQSANEIDRLNAVHTELLAALEKIIDEYGRDTECSATTLNRIAEDALQQSTRTETK